MREKFYTLRCNLIWQVSQWQQARYVHLVFSPMYSIYDGGINKIKIDTSLLEVILFCGWISVQFIVWSKM